MKLLAKSALPACLAVLLSAAWAQEDLSKVEIQTEKLSDTTYIMVGAGGNLGVSIGEDAVFVIDDQFAPLTPKIEAAIAKLTAKPVRFVLNTHWHFDHTGGNVNLGRAGALIVAHDNVRKRMSAEGFIEFLGMRTRPEPKVALPVVTFSTDTTFHLNGDEVYVFHVPRAHTDGDSIIHFRKSNVIHMGDSSSTSSIRSSTPPAAARSTASSPRSTTRSPFPTTARSSSRATVPSRARPSLRLTAT